MMHYTAAHGATLRIGYRTPGLTKTLDARGKMDLALELGMSLVEPTLVPVEFPDWKSVEDYRKAADAAGLRIESVCAWPPLTDPGAKEQLQESLDRVLEYREVLGFNYVAAPMFYPPENFTQKEIWKLLVENVRRAADYWGEAGVTLALEPERFVGTAERMARLLRLLDRPGVKVNFDPTNFYNCGSDPLEAFLLFADRIQSGHIKDSQVRGDKKKEVPVGEGDMEYPPIFQAALDRRINLAMYIEHCRSADEVRAAARAIQPLVEAVWR